MEIAGLALMGIGLLGCFINKIPGPLIAFIGLLIINFATKMDIPTEIIIVCGVLSVISLIIASNLRSKRCHKINTTLNILTI